MSAAENFAPVPLREAVLDRPTCEQLFADLAGCTQLLSVLARERGGSRPTDLDDGRARLLAGTATALQIRYRFAGEEWWDTLISTPEGIRLVRICQESAP